MTTIIIARHGNTFNPGDVVTRVGARTDLPLTEGGKAQALALGEHFRGRQISFDRAFCSPLQRTKLTATILLDKLEQSPVPSALEFLREIDYGPDENVAEDIVRERIGEKALEDWENSGLVPEGWIVDPEALKADWASFFEETSVNFPNETILVVTSNGVARFALQAANAGSEHPLKLKTGAYGEVHVTPEGAVAIASWNVRP